MTSTVSWHQTRQQAIAAFQGDTPHPQTEQDILDVFENSPQIVLREIDRLADQIANGRPIRSPWAVLRSNVTKAAASSLPDSVVQLATTADRNDRVRKAEQWMRNAGLHYDRWDPDVFEELFGDLGRIRYLASDQALVDRMRHLWLELRPAGERCETEAEERAERWKQQQTKAHDPERVTA